MSNLNLDSFESGFVSVLTDECECVELSNALMSSSFSSRRQIMYEIQKHTHTKFYSRNVIQSPPNSYIRNSRNCIRICIWMSRPNCREIKNEIRRKNTRKCAANIVKTAVRTIDLQYPDFNDLIQTLSHTLFFFLSPPLFSLMHTHITFHNTHKVNV